MWGLLFSPGSIWRIAGGGLGGNDPLIRLSSTTLPEDTATSTEVLTASVSGDYTGTPAFTLAGDDAAYFSIDSGTGILTLESALDYEDQDELAITIEVADITPLPAVNPRPFTISVTNVFEAATLNALTLDNDEIWDSAAQGTLIGTLQDVAVGSTLSLIDSDGGQFQLDGEDIEVGPNALVIGAQSITVRETLADSSNSPRDSIIAITVSDLLEAPVLTWVTDGTDNTPEFSVDLPDGVADGTDIELEISDDINFGGTPDETVLGDVSGDPTTLTAADALADGTWYARARYTGSAWSNVETETISTGAGSGWNVNFWWR